MIVLTCLVAVVATAPQFQDQPQQQRSQLFQQQQQQQRPVVQLLRDDRFNDGLGQFTYAVEADNGIYVENLGTQGSQGQVNMQGGYRLPNPDGTFVEVRFISDEFGTRVESPILPTPHPLPAHAREQLRIAKEQRAAGITFD